MDKILNLYRPYYLNSTSYCSKDWRLKENCSVYSNRKLCLNEMVADFDGITLQQRGVILKWFFQRKFKFWLYASSDSGCHVHFFTKFKNKYHKQELLRLIESAIKVPIDTSPVLKGWIRAEDSIHPVKGTKKELIYTNVNDKAYLSTLFFFCEFSDTITQKVFSVSTTGVPANISQETTEPRSISFIKNHVFTDGKKRLLFVLISWWKSRGHSQDVVLQKAKQWCKMQSYHIQDFKIISSFASNRGIVRDNYRINLLKELNIDLDSVKTVNIVPKTTGKYAGF